MARKIFFLEYHKRWSSNLDRRDCEQGHGRPFSLSLSVHVSYGWRQRARPGHAGLPESQRRAPLCTAPCVTFCFWYNQQWEAKERNDVKEQQLPFVMFQRFTIKLHMGNHVYASMRWAKASHFPFLPFRLNSALPDTGIFGIHPLNLPCLSTVASGSKTWILIYLSRLYAFETRYCRRKLPQHFFFSAQLQKIQHWGIKQQHPEEQSQLTERGLQPSAHRSPPMPASRRAERGLSWLSSLWRRCWYWGKGDIDGLK